MAVRTPLLRCHAESRIAFLKPENLQPIGSFKLRGAYNKIASLSRKATIVMPSIAPKLKLEKTKALGAEVVEVGPSSDERKQRAEALAAEHGYALIPPYDDETIIAGQGTMGLEILEDLSDVTNVLVCVGGGGMISEIVPAPELRRQAAALAASLAVAWVPLTVT